jgi:hypothetical protein
MNQERTKKLAFKPCLYWLTAASLALTVGLGISNFCWVVIFKVPNPALIDAFYISI